MNQQMDSINRINKVLKKENQNIAQMRLFADEQQENALNFRGKIIKNNYKYLKKIDKVDDMIKTAKEINMNMLDKNKKTLQRRERNQVRQIDAHRKSQNEEHVDIQPTVHEPNEESKVESQKLNMNQALKEQCRKHVKDQDEPQKIKQIEEEKVQQVPTEMQSGRLNNSLTNIDIDLVKNYFRQKIDQIKIETKAEDIYKIMAPFYELCGIQIKLPLIKKYKNCLYFGQNNKKQYKIYEGFLIFTTDKKLYFGQMFNEKKNGKGVEIDFANEVIYDGQFEAGKKNGQFTVIKPHEIYHGQLKKGQYHGYGELNTEFSKYTGYFDEGMRHGRGEEQFKSGLAIEGQFIMNKFSNNNRAVPSQRSNTMVTGSQRNPTNTLTSRVNESQLEASSQRSNIRTNQPSSKEMNPESLQVEMKCDKNVQFQPSPHKNKNYQEFHFKFEDDEEDYLQFRKKKTSKDFRIKQSPRKDANRTKRKFLSHENSQRK